SEPYDPYIPPKKANEENDNGEKHFSNRTSSVQQQVDDVVNIMQDNIDKVMNRGERIDDLRDRAEDLNATAGNFKRGANQVRKRMWWKDLKWKIIIGTTILVILGIIIGKPRYILQDQVNNVFCFAI
ncbi:synaptobrevin-domain-containing protein, partial [Chlamydoabsidia padenii]